MDESQNDQVNITENQDGVNGGVMNEDINTEQNQEKADQMPHEQEEVDRVPHEQEEVGDDSTTNLDENTEQIPTENQREEMPELAPEIVASMEAEGDEAAETKELGDDDDWDDDNPLTDELALECLEELQLNAAGNAYGYTIFNASGKKISSLGKGFKKFTSLKLANFEYNRLRILEGFGSLTELLWINAEHNLLESLPKLPQEKLQRIFASHNKLITLKKSESPSVEELDVSYNQIENLEGLPAWPSLKTIDLSHNDILTCKKCGGHPNLLKLNMSFNPNLSSFTGIGEFPNLKELYIDEIGEIASFDDFKTFFPSLEILSMKHNIFKIKLIQPLSELQNLKSLLMQDCKICSIKNYRTEVVILVPQISILDDVEITEDDKAHAKSVQEEREEEARRKAEAEAEAAAQQEDDD